MRRLLGRLVYYLLVLPAAGATTLVAFWAAAVTLLWGQIEPWEAERFLLGVEAGWTKVRSRREDHTP